MHGQKRVMVTGGTGFLGSFLCERLLREGNDVLCVDNYYTGSRDNVLHLLDDSRFEVLRHDITFPLYVEVDEIYNLACPASPVHYQFDPVQTVKTNVHGAINMLGLAKRTKAKIFQPPRAKFTAIRQSTRSRRSIGAVSIPSGRGHAMTKASGVPKRCSSTIIVSMAWKSGWRGSSILTGRACRPMMAASSPISSFRRFKTSRSPSSATARKRAPSAT